MDILQSLFTLKQDMKDEIAEEEFESGSEDGEENSVETVPKVTKIQEVSPKNDKTRRCRIRPDRGKFTILDGARVADPEEVLEIDFSPELLQRIFQDSRVGIQFLARYGIIPNTRECKIENCPKEQFMSLIKHANGYVWRCRSCRKRRERRVITKISVYEGTFLFYSRMPMNKFFIFMLIWSENPGFTAAEYNRLLGEFRLVEETIHNTIGFIKDHIQSWVQLKSSRWPIGGEGRTVEMLETFHTEDVSAKHRNRRERHFTMRIVLICWETNEISICEFPDRQFTRELLESTLYNNLKEKSTVVMRDLLLERFGEVPELNALFNGMYYIKTIADVWKDLSETEKDKQFIKTLMESVQSAASVEPFAYEYFFRRTFVQKPFNHLLKAIRELYSSNSFTK
ncbi:unnamed protein product [Auanema sp. JU1783]|nr:unnamed protein product [Auanema sp. JU1783]